MSPVLRPIGILDSTRLVVALPICALLLLGCGDPPGQPPALNTSRSDAEAPATHHLARSPDLNPDFALPAQVESKLPIYEITMPPWALAEMEANPFGDTRYPVSFSAGSVTYKDVEMRYRGAWARTWPKKPLKLFFSKEQSLEGERRLNLNSSFRDPSFIRETVAYHIYRAAGVPASESQLARVHLNGQFRGLYVQVEQPDKVFLEKRGLKGAVIFKASSRGKQADQRPHGTADAYREHYEQETRKAEEDGFVALAAFCDGLAREGDTIEFFEQHVDLERYINYVAATVLCQNWDAFNKNHFLVLDRQGANKWFVIPWDLDRSLGDHWDWSFGRVDLPIDLGTQAKPGVTGWNRLLDRFLSHPELRRRLAERLNQLLMTEFTPEKLDPLIDELHAAIAPEAALDYRRWPSSNRMPWLRNDRVPLDRHIQSVKRYVADRRAFLLAELPKLEGGR